MTKVFAFISGRPQTGQSTITAELAFEWVKRGASACILTTRHQIEAMGFDCFALDSLAPPSATGGRRDLTTLVADLSQLEDYDYFILDLPVGSLDLAIAAGLAGADLVVPISIEQGALGDVSGMFRQIARRPPLRPLRLVLNQVRNRAAASDATKRLIASIETKLHLPARLAANLPWDADLAAIEAPTDLLGMTLPTAALVRAIVPLADALEKDALEEDALDADTDGAAASNVPLPSATIFWKQFQTHLSQPAPQAEAPLELSEPVPTPAAPRTAPRPPAAALQAASAPELAAQLDRIATSLELLSKEVVRLRSGLAGKFDFEDDGEGKGRKEGAGEPILLDFDTFRQAHGKE